MKNLVGVDIGATNTKIGIFSASGSIISKWSIPTDLCNNGNFIVSNLIDSLYKELALIGQGFKNISRMGIGVPGPVNDQLGSVIQAVNLGWKDYQVKSEIEKMISVSVDVGNDANIAALGEMNYGSGRGSSDIAMFTLGSGVGGAAILNGKLLTGRTFSAGEFGHIKIYHNRSDVCGCGKTGCLESVASGLGIVKAANDSLQKGRSSILTSVIEYKGRIEVKDVLMGYEKNDDICLEIIDNYCRDVALAMSNVCCILNPQKIIVGGGIADAGAFIIEKIKLHFKNVAFGATQETEIIKASLGNDAGIYGAMSLAKNQVI
ncbi:ROK family glucokinase [Klebsiella pneumoniae]|uniref:ROK family glucokinase n=1 Tax=Klebsiella pneumoniae TaxID=573 RepID=UPI001ABCAE7C|nr:ROK family glucokinase [Klebsiella pneumoniae]MBO3721281.1 ROK family glucokinase [Klebsiella pneumoniae]HCM5830597.1 ROK family glucokinase [Klebsiella pneumoniae]